MYALLGSLTDFVHALLMVAWVLGLPLLFWHRHPRATRWYALYAVTFICLNQASKLLLNECFLTTIARALWERGGAPRDSSPNEWFTVRLARAVFRMTPSHRGITTLTQILIFVTAAGMLIVFRREREARSLRATTEKMGSSGAS